ncbi:polynucleotide adenylyltransferase PcnB [bacterium SCSIO 12696]|nr:polynucleotide adenylyltransferase PcnB [bacterium SCSIO 12696]
MLNWLKNRLAPAGKNPRNAPYVLSSKQHPISPRDISKAAQDVVAALNDAGYQAYVVGGCIRDLLLKTKPKDFDVATDATPEQVKDLFRRSRIVGRRFQIVHVRMGREVIEVTTFRAHHQGNDKQAQQSKQGMLLRDNVFGDISQDAARRDFTINGFYYQPQDNSIYDYANGLADLKQRTLRMIGDPEQRYREDPVRMLRAVRFAAKLGFDIEPKTLAPIHKLAKLLKDIPPARLFDEVIKLLMSGNGLATFHLMREQQLFQQLFPNTEALLIEDPQQLEFIEQALINTDQRIRSGKRVTPAFMYAALLWPVVVKHSQQFLSGGESPAYAWQHGANLAIEQQLPRIAIPRRFTNPMRDIWSLQQRLPRRAGKQAERVMGHPRFRAGYDFVLLREQAGEDLEGLGQWWTIYQEADETKRQDMCTKLHSGKKPGRRRRKRGPRRKSGNPA